MSTALDDLISLGHILVDGFTRVFSDIGRTIEYVARCFSKHNWDEIGRMTSTYTRRRLKAVGRSQRNNETIKKRKHGRTVRTRCKR